MSAFFTLEQERAYKRIKLLQEEIDDTELHNQPCPLLHSQLNEMMVLLERMQHHVRILHKLTKNS